MGHAQKLNRNKKRKKRLMQGQPTQPCVHCCRELPRKELTLDHVIPRSRGGTYKDDNVKLACRDCNKERGDMEFYTFNTKKRKSLGLEPLL